MLASSNVFLIRHAEKRGRVEPRGLSPMGEARAQAYAAYFPSLPLAARAANASGHYHYLFASHQTDESDRPHLTLQPLADRLRLEINTGYRDDDYSSLASQLLVLDEFEGRNIIVCWHHGTILKLADELLQGRRLPPNADWPRLRVRFQRGRRKKKWPDEVFGWLLWIEYDAEGKLAGNTGCYR